MFNLQQMHPEIRFIRRIFKFLVCADYVVQCSYTCSNKLLFLYCLCTLIDMFNPPPPTPPLPLGVGAQDR